MSFPFDRTPNDTVSGLGGFPDREIPEILLPDLPPLFGRPGQKEVFLSCLRRIPLPVWEGFLSRQRWFALKNEPLRELAYRKLFSLGKDEKLWVLAFLELATQKERHTYFLPLSLRPLGIPASQASPWAVARLRSPQTIFLLADALGEDAFCHAFLLQWAQEAKLSDWEEKSFLAWKKGPYFPQTPNLGPVQRPSWEQSNSSVVFGNQILVKWYRRIQTGRNPEEELAQFFAERSPCPFVPPWLGSVTGREESGEIFSLAVGFSYLRAQGDGWSHTLELLKRTASQEKPGDTSVCREWAQRLGEVLASVHTCLARPTGEPAFDPEPVEAAHLRAWKETIQAELEETIGLLQSAYDTLTPGEQELAKAFFQHGPSLCRECLARFPSAGEFFLCRYHGDLHLGQVLFSSQGIWIIDWEGEPHRTLQERRQKGSPLRDVAGLLRSLAYAASYLYCNAENSRANAFQEALSRLAQEMEKALLSRYEAKTQGLLTLPQDSGFRLLLLEAFAWQKALYELRYELSHRPGWVRTALQSLVWFLERKQRFGTPWAEWEG